MKYCPAPFGTFRGALRQQSLVDVALHVGLHRHPLLGLDQVHDQPTKRGGVLDLRPRLLEDFAEHPRLRAEVFQDVAILGLQFVAFLAQQACPVVASRDDRLPVVGRLGLLVRHLEEEQEGDLLDVGHVTQAVVPEDVGEVPGFADDLLGVGAHGLKLLSWSYGMMPPDAFQVRPGRPRGTKEVSSRRYGDDLAVEFVECRWVR